jgi:hypothetical protein
MKRASALPKRRSQIRKPLRLRTASFIPEVNFCDVGNRSFLNGCHLDHLRMELVLWVSWLKPPLRNLFCMMMAISLAGKLSAGKNGLSLASASP